MFSEISLRGAGDANGMVSSLFHLLIVGICVGIVYFLGVWFIATLTGSATVRKVWDGLFLLLGAVVVINFLMGLGGHAFIAW